jgi:hypothetical protein
MAGVKPKTAIWVVLVALGIIVLALLPPVTVRSPKAQAGHITGVNNVRSVTLTLTNVGVPPGSLPVIIK